MKRSEIKINKGDHLAAVEEWLQAERSALVDLRAKNRLTPYAANKKLLIIQELKELLELLETEDMMPTDIKKITSERRYRNRPQQKRLF